ncbi:DedA family protein, partial [Pseudomonas syringae pv. tagetis]
MLQVIGWATLGGILGDQVLFWTGRYSGERLLPSLKRHQSAIERVEVRIKRYPTTSVFAVRF